MDSSEKPMRKRNRMYDLLGVTCLVMVVYALVSMVWYASKATEDARRAAEHTAEAAESLANREFFGQQLCERFNYQLERAEAAEAEVERLHRHIDRLEREILLIKHTAAAWGFPVPDLPKDDEKPEDKPED